jgi:hypothetical protein
VLPPRTDQPESADDEGVSHSGISQAPEDIIAYWTPERMGGAKPREGRLPEPVARAEGDVDGDPEQG